MLPAAIHCYVLSSMQRESLEDLQANPILFPYCFQDDTFAPTATAPPLREGYCVITKSSLSITLLNCWSSCRAYTCGEPDTLVTEDPCCVEWSPDASRRQSLWRQFLLGEDLRDAVIRRQECAMGALDFCWRLAIAMGPPLPRRRGRPRKASIG